MRRSALTGLTIVVLAWTTVLAGLRFVDKPRLVNRIGGSQAVFDEPGNLLRLSLSSDERYRLWVPLDDLPASLVDATLLQEDRWFYWHPGVNPISLLRALYVTYVGGGRRIGGSTLTMQLARLRFGIDSSQPTGKLVQIARALQIERHYDKDQILEAYLNLAPYGGNIEGAGAASLIYFGKQVESLDWREALTLTVIPKSPRNRTPRSAQGHAELAAARERLFRQWRPPAPDVSDESLATDIRRREALPFRAPHFVDRVLSGWPYERRISTTLDLRLQRLLETQLQQFIARNRSLGIRNGSLLLADYRTMAMRAYVGSADFWDAAIQGQVDGIRGRRSPGSALKPFIYALALDQGLINPLTMLKDTSLSISAYNPENFDRDFLGPVNATDALVRSCNLPAIQLTNQLHDADLYGFLRAAGIGGLRARDIYGLALALGGSEVRIDELASLYAMLANGGVLRPLRLLASAPSHVAEGGGPWQEHHAPPHAYERAHTPEPIRLLSPEASFLVLEMLRENPRPDQSQRSADVSLAKRVPWKTGTSYGFHDAWAVGVVGSYVLVAWVGNFDGKPNPAFVGRDAAGPLFFSVVDALQASEPLREPPASNVRLVRREVCALSGQLPGPHCPHRRETSMIPGRSPIDTCTIHREVAIDRATGLRACPDQINGVVAEIYEFWPSDLLALFRDAGIARRRPPPYQPRCAQSTTRGRAPLIALPQPTVQYAMHGDASVEIPFSAVTDGDSEQVFWFVDDALVGESPSGRTFFWRARPGRFALRAVDDHGRSVSSVLQVVLLAN